MNAPSASRPVLVLLAGLIWSAVGIGLTIVAVVWLISSHGGVAIALGVGLVGGALVYRFGFSKLVKVNLERIFAQAPGKEKVCLFAFQNTRSYVILVVMIALGYTLRHLPVPRIYLVPIYMTIGLALFLSSLGYYASLRT